jgi:hypothetical protein
MTPSPPPHDTQRKTKLEFSHGLECGDLLQAAFRLTKAVANRDLVRIPNVNTVHSVIDAHLDERQCYRLWRNGKGLLAVRRLVISGRLA